VLDRLAEAERIMIHGISATSAGAMNAVVFTYGWSEGGRNGARQALTNFWRRILTECALFEDRVCSWHF
jgi:NTE family protein